MIKHMKVSDIPRDRGNHYILNDLRDFMECGAVAGEVVVPAGKNGKAVYAAYYRVATKKGFPVKITRLGDRVFVEKVKK